ncbi:MAG: Zn-ribbon domain-containing OB-fold protein [Thermoprotei archaeon]
MSKPSQPKGTAIEPKDWSGGRYFFKRDQFDLHYSWDSGIAISKFLRGLKQGKIIGRRCNNCGRTLVPPRMFCEECFTPTHKWVEVKDTGSINTFSISYVNNDASRRKEPLPVAVINIDGASPGMGFLHILGEVDPDKIHVGMKVKAVWKPAQEREGSITDIRYFKPEES